MEYVSEKGFKVVCSLCDPGFQRKSLYFQVAMMGIVLLSPTLQTLVMDKLSSTHLGTIQMGITRGYERSIQSPRWLCYRQFVIVCKMSLSFLLMLKDGYQQNYKRGTGQGPRGMSRGSTQAMRS